MNEVKQKGIDDVSSVVNTGYGAEEIITLGRHTPEDFIAMSTHGRSGIQRWVLGSVTERVVASLRRSGVDCPERLKDRFMHESSG